MTHNDFHMDHDIMTPMKEFIQSIIPLYEKQKYWAILKIKVVEREDKLKCQQFTLIFITKNNLDKK